MYINFDDILTFNNFYYDGYNEKTGGSLILFNDIANKYSTILNLKTLTSSPSLPSKQEVGQYKQTVNNDCIDNKVSEHYIDSILDLHKKSYRLNKKEGDQKINLTEEINQTILLQLNLLSSVQINKCSLMNLIRYCNEHLESKIYTLASERNFIKYIVNPKKMIKD